MTDTRETVARAMDALLAKPMGHVPPEAEPFYNGKTGKFDPAAIAAMPPVRVKALEWDTLCAIVFEDGSGQVHCKASGCFGLRYIVLQTPSEGIYATCSSDSWVSFHNTVEAAKTAAQADYEARILAALEPQETQTDETQNPATAIKA